MVFYIFQLPANRNQNFFASRASYLIQKNRTCRIINSFCILFKKKKRLYFIIISDENGASK
ncbi:hypothetical protein BpHYR1_054001 [Brachionus plicatilis]|uniref:Uncharacterized protein n=1 Tax=Brachionus plicatilis TaxID=10195 RepID=A0A3M7S5J2_BRAPC|nr:hypothetical protein BpHYR1_054001 [Brachionus plicatilis]